MPENGKSQMYCILNKKIKEMFFKMRKGCLLASLLFLSVWTVGAKNKIEYVSAEKLTITGKLMETPASPFHRVDTVMYSDIPAVVKRYLTHSAGLAVCFRTNSPEIWARWEVSPHKGYANLTPIANKGLDLYIRRDGKWQAVGAGSPKDVYTENVIAENMDSEEKECLLYLPLYDETRRLEIGIAEGAYIYPAVDPFQKRIVVYGSSVLQGASASRPGMAYAARLSRETGLNFINVGISGNGKMHAPVVEMFTRQPADAFILDCIPNPSADEITERAPKMIRALRASHPEVPIIVIQTLIREKSYFDQAVEKRVKSQNQAIDAVMQQLSQEQIPHLYYIREDNFLGTDHEGATDGVHPNDLGFDRMLNKTRPQILSILKQYGIY